MNHPSYVAHAADSHRTQSLAEAQTRRMLRAARKGPKAQSRRRDTSSSVVWRQPLASKQARS